MIIVLWVDRTQVDARRGDMKEKIVATLINEKLCKERRFPLKFRENKTSCIAVVQSSILYRMRQEYT